jgi:hypothetical protein
LLYEGGFIAGVMQGAGVLYGLRQEVAYRGDFLNGLFDGKGSLYEGGRLVYSGGFAAGLRDGYGTEYHANGSVGYKGTFRNGLYDAEGVLYSPEGRVVYRGGFLDGAYQGRGALYTEDQLLLEGEFEKGAVKGDAQLFYNGALAYAGAAPGGRPEGFGVLYDLRGGKALYRGNLREGMVDGRGLLGLPLEDVYGAFADVKPLEAKSAEDVFYAANPELGLTLFFPLKTEGRGVAATKVYLYPGQGETLSLWLPWGGRAKSPAEENPSEENTTDEAATPEMATPEIAAATPPEGSPNPVPLTYAESYALRNPALPSRSGYAVADFGGAAPFGPGLYYQTTFLLPDCALSFWSADREGDVFLLEWSADLGPEGPPAEQPEAPEEIPEATENRVDTLLTTLGLLSSTRTREDVKTDLRVQEDAAWNPYYGTGDIKPILKNAKLTPAETREFLRAMVDFLEAAENRAAAERKIEIKEEQILRLEEDRAARMTLEDEIADLRLQASMRAVAMEKAQMVISYRAAGNLRVSDLQQALFIYDPTELDIQQLLDAALLAGTIDTLDFKLNMLEIGVMYERILWSRDHYDKKSLALDEALEQYELGKATETDRDAARTALIDARIGLYTSLCAYTREMLILDELTDGVLGLRYSEYYKD